MVHTRSAPWVAWTRLLFLSAGLMPLLGWAWTRAQGWNLWLVCLVIAILLAQFAFLGHDAGHGTLHTSPMLNKTLGQFCMTVVAGLAFTEWYSRHRDHHRYCQVEQDDPDMDVSLLVSLTENSRKSKSRIGRFLTRHQAVHVWFLSLLFALSQRHLSQWGALESPLRYWRDLLPLAAHFGLWIVLPLLVLQIDAGRVAIVYVAPLLFLGPYLAAIFWLNHIGMPLVQESGTLSFLEHQSATSRTLLNSKRLDWVFGGLNYQIEHHLFPKLPSFCLRRVQPIVQASFARHGLNYNGTSFTSALRSVAGHFRQIAES